MSNRLGAFVRLLSLVSLAAFSLLMTRPAAARSYVGNGVAVGGGYARVVIVTTSAGTPSSISVVMDRRVLQGMPSATVTRSEWEYLLPLPDGAPLTGYDHVTLTWYPQGHAPRGTYAAAHFGVHFYLVGRSAQESARFDDKARWNAGAAISPSLVPPGYVVVLDPAVGMFGMHGLNPEGPEFHGGPFTRTFLYGYDRGAMIYLEPMVSLSYLRAAPDVTLPVATPAAYSTTGLYPERYRVAFDRRTDCYVVSLVALRSWTGSGELLTGRASRR
ncbi:MAG TPA: hypothetical protein VFA86_03135 [Gammaproteobacteria bacterium]|nr:hypothetical protein [Gammaproteobacteria bacterium]